GKLKTITISVMLISIFHYTSDAVGKMRERIDITIFGEGISGFLYLYSTKTEDLLDGCGTVN
uniref:hypothetical protein n=1 Tax=Salmonella enterica TaxID=28901 RepID=UPI003297ABF2